MRNNNSNGLRRNVASQLVYQLLSVLTPLIVTPYLSRTLGATEIGRYSYAHSIAYYFVVIAEFGITSYGSRRIAEVRNDKEKYEEEFSSLFWLHTSVSLLVLLAYVLSVALGVNSNDSDLSFIMIFYVLSSVVDMKWFFYGLEKFNITALRSVLIKTFYVILIFIFVTSEDDVRIYTFIMAFVCYFLSEATLFIIFPRYVRLRKPRWSSIKAEIKPMIALFLPSIATVLLRHFDKIMLGFLSTYEQLGFYENVDKVYLTLTLLITAVSDVLLPRISNMLATEDMSEADVLLRKTLKLSIIVSCALAIGMMAISNEFVPLFFGNGYLECIDILTWICPTIVILAFTVVIRKLFLIPRRKEKVFTIATVLGLLSNIIGNSALIPKFGALGAAYATLIAEMVVMICQFIMIRKEFNYIPYLKCVFEYIGIGLIMYGGVRLVARLPLSGVIQLTVEIITGVVIYIGLTALLMLLTNDDIYIDVRAKFREFKSKKTDV